METHNIIKNIALYDIMIIQKTKDIYLLQVYLLQSEA